MSRLVASNLVPMQAKTECGILRLRKFIRKVGLEPSDLNGAWFRNYQVRLGIRGIKPAEH